MSDNRAKTIARYSGGFVQGHLARRRHRRPWLTLIGSAFALAIAIGVWQRLMPGSRQETLHAAEAPPRPAIAAATPAVESEDEPLDVHERRIRHELLERAKQVPFRSFVLKFNDQDPFSLSSQIIVSSRYSASIDQGDIKLVKLWNGKEARIPLEWIDRVEDAPAEGPKDAAPEPTPNWQAQISDLQKRVEALEKSQQASTPAPGPNASASPSLAASPGASQ